MYVINGKPLHNKKKNILDHPSFSNPWQDSPIYMTMRSPWEVPEMIIIHVKPLQFVLMHMLKAGTKSYSLVTGRVGVSWYSSQSEVLRFGPWSGNSGPRLVYGADQHSHRGGGCREKLWGTKCHLSKLSVFYFHSFGITPHIHTPTLTSTPHHTVGGCVE